MTCQTLNEPGPHIAALLIALERMIGWIDGSKSRENGWGDFIEVGLSLNGVSANLRIAPSKLYKYTGYFC
jgi:hypothetical protein